MVSSQLNIKFSYQKNDSQTIMELDKVYLEIISRIDEIDKEHHDQMMKLKEKINMFLQETKHQNDASIFLKDTQNTNYDKLKFVKNNGISEYHSYDDASNFPDTWQ